MIFSTVQQQSVPEKLQSLGSEEALANCDEDSSDTGDSSDIQDAVNNASEDDEDLGDYDWDAVSGGQ